MSYKSVTFTGNHQKLENNLVIYYPIGFFHLAMSASYLKLSELVLVDNLERPFNVFLSFPSHYRNVIIANSLDTGNVT